MISKCTHFSRESHPEACAVITSINKDTTPREFDQIVATMKIHGYKLSYGGIRGWNALGTAAYNGNVELIAHIVKKGGEKLLDLGNRSGITPLLFAAQCKNHQDGYYAAKKLIELGADINLAAAENSSEYDVASTEGETPLEVALEKTKNLRLVKLLIKRGAIIPSERLSHEGKETAIQVQEQILKRKAEMKHLKDQCLDNIASLIKDEKFLTMSDEEIKQELDRFLGASYFNNTTTHEEYIKKYQILFDAITQPWQPVGTQKEIGRLSRFIASKLEKDNVKPWMGFRVLENFYTSLNTVICTDRQLNEIKKVLREYLSNCAKSIPVSHESRLIQGTNIRLEWLKIFIDPRYWFGDTRSSSSLWNKTDNSFQPIPSLVREALLNYILYVQENNQKMPILIQLDRKSQAEFPENFTLPLVTELLAYKIFVETYSTISSKCSEGLDSFYHRSVEMLKDEELLSLVRL